MIPKKIHYCWFGGISPPRDVRVCIQSWREKCPDYEIKRWDEKNFDIACHPFSEAAYKAEAWAFVSDYARLKAVYEEGGIYLDTDVELLKNLDFLLKLRCFMGIQQVENLINSGLGFGAVRHHPMILEMMEEYDKVKFDGTDKISISCPKMNTAVLKRHGYQYTGRIDEIGGMTIFPPKFMDPYPSGFGANMRCKDTISIHHYSASWTGRGQRWKRKLVRAVGEDRVLAVKKIFRPWTGIF